MRAVTLAPLLAWCAACGSVADSHEPIVMNQALASNVTSGDACRDANFYIGETSYFRAFKLADYGVHGAFSVTSVSFTVHERAIGTGFTRFPIDINIYDYT